MSCVVRWVVVLVAVLSLGSCRPELVLEIEDEGVAPRVDPGTGGEFVVGSVVALDAGRSFDPDGDIRAYEWAMLRRPAMSQAAVVDPLAMSTSLTLDVAGSYELQLSIVDDAGLSSRGLLVLRAVAPEITADAGPDVQAPWRTTVQLAGTVSAEPGFDVTPSWSIVARPPGAPSQLVDAGSLAPSLYADREGTYRLRLTATTPHGTSHDDVAVTVTVPRQILPYIPVDVEYANARERFVIVSAAPAQLRLRDPATGTETAVALPATPKAVSVSPSGHRAAVAHSGKVTIVDLDTMTVIRTVDVTLDVREILYGPDDRVYCITTFGFAFGDLHIVHANTGVVVDTDAYPEGSARLHPSGTAIYSAQASGSPADFDRWTITPTTVEHSRNGPYHGQYEHGYDLWLTENGDAIIAQSGNVFHVSTNPDLDMTFRATLEHTLGGIQGAAHAEAAGLIAVLDTDWDAMFNNVLGYTLRLYDDTSLAHVDGIALPDTPVGSFTYASAGRFVAWRADGSMVYVITRSATGSGDVYALVPITP